MRFESRLTALREKMKSSCVERFLVTAPASRRYLSGFSGSFAWLLITLSNAFAITDSRYFDQLKEESPHFEAVNVEDGGESARVESLKKILGKRCRRDLLAFEAEDLTFARYEMLKDSLKPLRIVPTSGFVEELRLRKSVEEKEAIRKAAKIADHAFEAILQIIRPGIPERVIATEIQYAMRLAGSEGESFEIIVASGPNSALPHARTTDRVIREGEFVIIDFGASVEGYNSDFARTVWIGELEEEQKRIYRTVHRAQALVLEALGPGMPCDRADEMAREYIAREGFGEAFIHCLGHGVGLSLHENPRLAKGSKVTLAPGMVVTVEPGIYITGKGGVRIEDLVIINEDGYEILTKAPKIEL